jgi:hypothetical protein
MIVSQVGLALPVIAALLRGRVWPVQLLYSAAVHIEAQTVRVVLAIASIGVLAVVVVLLVVSVVDSNAVPWPLRWAPLVGIPLSAAAALLDAPVALALGLGLVVAGLGVQVWWDRVLGGARRDGGGRHGGRRRSG